ncbi:MAG: SDR family NAD(P)-dependent oxidoreductase, partial [Gammaproteobacteria bacterium]
MGARLVGKYAAVTGGAGGIGGAIARRYAAEGARVCVADLSERDAATTAHELGEPAHSFRLDVTSPASIEEFAAFT